MQTNPAVEENKTVRFGLMISDAVDQWLTRLHACVHASGGHFEHIL